VVVVFVSSIVKMCCGQPSLLRWWCMQVKGRFGGWSQLENGLERESKNKAGFSVS
jgi:hypothetical protein